MKWINTPDDVIGYAITYIKVYLEKPAAVFSELKGFADIVYIPKKPSEKPAMIIELKYDKSAEGAIAQIKEKRYVESLKEYQGNMLLVGINYDKMTKTPLTKLIVSLGIPTTISMLVTNIYNMVDTYFVGTLGESQQAATGILFTLQAIIQAIAFMLGQGSGTLVSKSLAEQDQEEASEYVSTAFFSGLVIGSILMVGGLLFLNPFMRLLGSTETILPYARQYGACVLITCPVMIGSIVINNNLRYEGKAFYSMIGLVSGGLLNIFGDYLFVVVFQMGVLGAGLATAISQSISFIILLYFFRKMAQSRIGLGAVSRELSVYGTISKIGFPAVIRQGLSSISSGLLNNLTKPYGDAAIAAMSIVNRFAAFIMCVGLGIGQGFQPVASFNYQAGEYKRVKNLKRGEIYLADLLK